MVFTEAYCMSHRTTLILDEEARAAARDLAHRYGCSISEAIRRAVVRQRDSVLGVSTRRREERRQVLGRLFEQFREHDPGDEIRRLEEEHEGF